MKNRRNIRSRKAPRKIKLSVAGDVAGVPVTVLVDDSVTGVVVDVAVGSVIGAGADASCAMVFEAS